MENNNKSKFKFLDKFKEIKTNKKVLYLISILLVVVIFCLFVSSLNKTKSKDNSNSSLNTNNKSLYLIYAKQTEDRLVNVLSSVKGLSNVKVFINISQSPKITYLSEQKNSSSQSSSGLLTNTIILAKDGTLTYPIVVLEELPKIEGVLIVAGGAGDPKKKLEIVNIISSVLGVNVSCIEVLEGK